MSKKTNDPKNATAEKAVATAEKAAEIAAANAEAAETLAATEAQEAEEAAAKAAEAVKAAAEAEAEVAAAEAKAAAVAAEAKAKAEVAAAEAKAKAEAEKSKKTADKPEGTPVQLPFGEQIDFNGGKKSWLIAKNGVMESAVGEDGNLETAFHPGKTVVAYEGKKTTYRIEDK